MPISASAKKSLRSAEAKHVRNVAFKVELKRLMKTITPETISSVVSKIDKAAKANLIHHNKASRLKARIAVKFPNTVVIARPSRQKATTAKPTAKKPVIKSAQAKPAVKKAEVAKTAVKKTVAQKTPKTK